MGAGGKVSLYNAAGTVDLIADVAGWYDDEALNDGGYYHAASPTRVLDTRSGTGASAQKVGPGGKLTIDVTDVSPTLSPIPAGATGRSGQPRRYRRHCGDTCDGLPRGPDRPAGCVEPEHLTRDRRARIW